MMAHQFKEPTPIKELAPDAPEKLVAVIERLMQKKPEDRYRGTDEIADELLPLAGDLPNQAPAAAAEPPPRPRQSKLLSANPVLPGPRASKMMSPGAAPAALYDAPVPAAGARPGSGMQRRAGAPRTATPKAPPAAYPPTGGYPNPPAHTSPAAANPFVTGANSPAPNAAAVGGKVPTRKDMRGAAAGPVAEDFMMPPGFVEESRGRSISPVVYAVIGVGVMAFTYMALLAFK
jgi:serine/threonine-protein kinase